MTREAPLGMLVAALAALYLIWGSTYLAIRFAIETLPPYLMVAGRWILAGVLLYGVLRWRGAPKPTLAQWKSMALVGTLLILGGNGLVSVAEFTVPSGVTALVIGAIPLLVALVDWLRPGGTRPTLAVAGGIALGLLGVVVLVGPGEIAGDRGVDPMGAAVILLACAFWSLGSVWGRSLPRPESALLAASMQMIAGGLASLLAAAGSGELARIDPTSWSTKSVLAFVYLTIAGSIVAYSAYVWLLQNVTPTLATSYAFVNPVVAVVLGTWLASEPFTARTAVAAVLIIVAVAMLVARKGAAARPPSPPPRAAEDARVG